MTWVIHEGKAYEVIDVDDDGDDSNNDSLCIIAPSFWSFFISVALFSPLPDTEEVWVRRGDVKCYYTDEIASILEEHYKREVPV